MGEAAQIHNYNLTETIGIKSIDYVHVTPYTKCSKWGVGNYSWITWIISYKHRMSGPATEYEIPICNVTLFHMTLLGFCLHRSHRHGRTCRLSYTGNPWKHWTQSRHLQATCACGMKRILLGVCQPLPSGASLDTGLSCARFCHKYGKRRQPWPSQ